MAALPFNLLLALTLFLSTSHCLALSLQTHDAIRRRSFGQRIAVVGGIMPPFAIPTNVNAASLAELQATAQKARNQLDAVPAIIQTEE